MLRRIFGKGWQSSRTSDVTSQVRRDLARVLGRCAHCDAELSNHAYVLLATEIVGGDKDALTSFFQAVKDHDWVKLRAFQRWEGGSDDIELYAIKCLTDQISVSVIKTHFEFLAASRLLYCEPLSVEEGSRLLETFTGVEWRRFP